MLIVQLNFVEELNVWFYLKDSFCNKSLSRWVVGWNFMAIIVTLNAFLCSNLTVLYATKHWR